jgi:hypothetical protein
MRWKPPGPRTRSPSRLAVPALVTRLDFEDDIGKVVGMIESHDVGQYPVAQTKTRTLRDVYGWLSECDNFGEFDEATTVFARANTLLENLPAR